MQAKGLRKYELNNSVVETGCSVHAVTQAIVAVIINATYLWPQ